jgi:DNA repair exonuclease SbcCD ATPase subunit
MCKKFLIAGVAVILGLVVVRNTEVGSHLRALWRDAKATVRNSVPIPNEIERLRAEIDRLDNVYRTQFSPVAEQMVALEKLKKEIAQIEKKLTNEHADILTMKKDLESGASKITYGDVTYTRARVEADLDRRFEAYKACEAGLKAKQNLLEAKEEKLSTAMKRLEEMKNAKSELQAELARLENEYEKVRLAQEQSDLKIDDSELARIKTSMADLRERVDVERKKCELAGQFLTSPVKVASKAEKRDLLKEIDEHFGKNDVKIEGKVASGN